MSNRKEDIKKSLGISEYPWSSDEEEDEEHNEPQPVSAIPDILQRTSRDRQSVADTPGTSGQQSSTSTNQPPAPVKVIEARMERELYWSLINGARRTTHTPRTSTRVNEAPTPHTSTTSRVKSPGHYARGLLQLSKSREDAPEMRVHRRTDRTSEPVDIQRFLEFKRLSRSLQNMAQGRAPANAAQRAAAGSSQPPQRSSSSSHSTPRALFILATREPPQNVCARHPVKETILRQIRPRHSTFFDQLLKARGVPVISRKGRSGPIAGTSWSASAGTSGPTSTSPIGNMPGPSQPTENFNNTGSWEDGFPSVAPLVQPKTEPSDEPGENIVEENIEEPSHTDTTDSGAGLIEEVLEVEAPDESINNPPPPGTEPDEENAETSAENNTNAEASTSEIENAGSARTAPSPHGLKRKRHASEETNQDPDSVYEFNQILLRLLECPVCLETVEPPITQCRRGHLTCSRCRSRLLACPVCRTPFSSVRNRAMEGVAEMLRFPCRHGCGREVRLRRRLAHEASCNARRYYCPSAACAHHPSLAREELTQHLQCKHLPILKIGQKHKFSIKVNSEQHDMFFIMALDEFFQLRVDADLRSSGIGLYVAYIGPKRTARHFTYEITVEGQHHAKKLVYFRTTHNDIDSSTASINRQDCFHLSIEQSHGFFRGRTRHCESDKVFEFEVEINRRAKEKFDGTKDDSES